MLPIKLKIQNFLPYRAPDELLFDGIQMACLTGANGAGKSSVLDAITWALWGEARARREDDLIHQGQTEMSVQLDFVQDGLTYRVVRQRRRQGRSGSGMLNLFGQNPQGEWVTISEGSMRETQRKINQLLHLTYDTFVHSAYLQQGRADAFTTRTPAERKQILADILGLADWERYEERAKERLKAVSAEITYHQRRIDDITRELHRQPGLEADAVQAAALLRDAEAALALAQERLDAVRDAPRLLSEAQTRRAEQERQTREAQRELTAAQDEAARYQQQIDDSAELLAQAPEIVRGYDALQSARQRDDALREKLDRLNDLDRERATLTQRIEAERAKLQADIARAEQTVRELTLTVDSNPQAELEALAGELDALRSLEAKREILRMSESNALEELSAHRANLTTLEKEGKEKRQRLDTLSATDSPTCPLCGQELSAEHRTAVLQQLSDEITAFRTEFANSRARAKQLEANLADCKSQLAELERHLKALPALQERAGRLQSRSEAASQAAQRREHEQAQLDALTRRLTDEDYAHELRAALTDLNARAADLGYSRDEHTVTRQTLDEHRRYEALKARLDAAQTALPMYEKSRDNALARQARLQAHLATLQEQAQALLIEMAGLEERARTYAQRENEVRLQHQAMLQARDRLSRIQQELDALEAQREQREGYQLQLASLQDEASLLDVLKTAFGKNGVPAMIIESAIPELEALANDLLRRMTEGRMTLRLNTQREKQTGGMAETLDIEIADELGTRTYELFSGGEAFRVNFALRVALSKLLARRAGAQLRTLFIDEGFGTQDDEGRAKLVEAITAIQDDFDLIIVITHIEDLRDNFPVHIMVEKTATGSRIVIR
jgi:exonuclease SbcC